MYCCRKNPTHFAGYCHPGDDSYDEAVDAAIDRAEKKAGLRDKGMLLACRMVVKDFSL